MNELRPRKKQSPPLPGKGTTETGDSNEFFNSSIL